MAWSTGAGVRVHNVIIKKVLDFIDAEHNGYQRLEQPVLHRRKVLYVKRKCYLVQDVFIGKGYQDVELNYHFSPFVSIEQSGKVEMTVRKGGKIIGALEIIAPSNSFKSRIYYGSNKPIRGWYSDGYGHKRPSPTLNIGAYISLPFVITTLIFPSADGQESWYRTKIIGQNTYLITGPDSMDLVIMRDPGDCKLKDLEFDGELLYLSVDSDSKISYLLLGGVKRLYYKKNKLFESETAQKGLEIFSHKIDEMKDKGFYLSRDIFGILEDFITAQIHGNYSN